MTVCIAAICYQDSWPMIVMVSDRQYTVADHWKYEPFYTKHHPFGQNAVALVSGNISDWVTIGREAERKLGFPVPRDTNQIADALASAFAEFRRSQAERGLLTPIGLSLEQLTRDSSLPASLVTELVDEMRRWELGDAAIVAGIDAGGNAHIYSVLDPGWPTCEDGPGFVAVGSGADHAMALFMRQNYTWGWSPARALFLAYSAKRYAEVDPFVGLWQTDVYVLGPGDHPYAPLHQELKGHLEKAYVESRLQELKMTGDTYGRYEEHVAEFLKNQQQGATQPTGEIQAPLLDEKEISGGPEESEPET